MNPETNKASDELYEAWAEDFAKGAHAEHVDGYTIAGLVRKTGMPHATAKRRMERRIARGEWEEVGLRVPPTGGPSQRVYRPVAKPKKPKRKPAKGG